MSNNVTVGDHEYAIGSMNALTQLKVAKRIVPLMAAISTSQIATPNHAEPEGEPGVPLGAPEAQPSSIAAALAREVHRLSDADVDWLVLNTLTCVSRLEGGSKQPLVRGGNLMYNMLPAGDIVQLMMAVVGENLSGFFPGASAGMTEAS